jgi:hypothetical protein
MGRGRMQRVGVQVATQLVRLADQKFGWTVRPSRTNAWLITRKRTLVTNRGCLKLSEAWSDITESSSADVCPPSSSSIRIGSAVDLPNDFWDCTGESPETIGGIGRDNCGELGSPRLDTSGPGSLLGVFARVPPPVIVLDRILVLARRVRLVPLATLAVLATERIEGGRCTPSASVAILFEGGVGAPVKIQTPTQAGANFQHMTAYVQPI